MNIGRYKNILILIISVIVIYLFWGSFAIVEIRNSSMEPTFYDSDRVIMKRFFYNSKQSLLNKVVVFYFPYKEYGDIILEDKDKLLIKRCVGEPGDSISIVNGIIRNSRAGVLPNFARNISISSSVPFFFYMPITNSENYKQDDVLNMKRLYVPQKGDTIYFDSEEFYLYKKIIKYENGLGYGSTNLYHILNCDYYFLCGDNLIWSVDSRNWGFVPKQFICYFK